MSADGTTATDEVSARSSKAGRVEHLTVEQPGHGLQADVGMRPDRHRDVVGHGDRSVVIGEAPGSDRAPGR